jgi:hypothetical protein
MAQDMTDIAKFLWEDCTRIIAAGKVQRWDVLKWTVTVNIGLAAAAIALKNEMGALILTAVAILVGGLGWYLINHYNSRMTQMRSRTNVIVKFLFETAKIDPSEIMGDQAREPDIHPAFAVGAAGTGILYNQKAISNYDAPELRTFKAVIGASVAPSLLVLLLLWILPQEQQGVNLSAAESEETLSCVEAPAALQ